MKRLLKKEELNRLLLGLMKEYDVIAPIDEEELILFRPVIKVEQVLWDYPNSLKPIKEFFLVHWSDNIMIFF